MAIASSLVCDHDVILGLRQRALDGRSVELLREEMRDFRTNFPK
jgi:hypothetical protein